MCSQANRSFLIWKWIFFGRFECSVAEKRKYAHCTWTWLVFTKNMQTSGFSTQSRTGNKRNEECSVQMISNYSFHLREWNVVCMCVCMCVNTHVNKWLIKVIWSFFIRFDTRNFQRYSIAWYGRVERFHFEEMICVNQIYYGSLLPKLIFGYCFSNCRIWFGQTFRKWFRTFQADTLSHHLQTVCQHSFLLSLFKHAIHDLRLINMRIIIFNIFLLMHIFILRKKETLPKK